MKKDNNDYNEITLKLKEYALLLGRCYEGDVKIELNKIPSADKFKLNITEYNI